MLKKLQSLKAKKGFTLVELIVVIAIIAVLAAILVPTMLGYVTSSRVTSADSTAASLKDTVGNAMVETDTKGYSVPRSGEKKVELTGGNDGKVTVSGDVDASTNYPEFAKVIKDKIDEDYNFTKAWKAIVIIKDGKMAGCAYDSTGTESTLFTDFASASTFTGNYGWPKTDGVATSGNIIGTSPKLIKS